MAPPKKESPLRSPLISAFNNIVSINRSKSQMRSTQTSYNEFLRFMTTEVKNIEAIKLPDEKKIKKLSNINVSSTFGSAGSLLSGLASGALDAAGLVGNFFGGGGDKKKKPRAGKPIPKGQKVRLPGIRGLPIISAALTGLDFAQGIAGGESVGKAGAGALGSAAGFAGGALAGSALAGVIGQALVPIPGLGFVLGAAVGGLGSFAGGYLGDRAYEAVTGEGKAKEKQKAKLKQQEQQQKLRAASLTQITFPQVLDKFDSVVTNFEKAVSAGLVGPANAENLGQGKDVGEVGHEQIDPRTGGGQAPDSVQDVDYTATGGGLPSKYINTKDYGEYRPYYNGGRGGYHQGEDLPITQGTKVSVIVPGKVAQAGFDGGGAGGNILITHEDGRQTRYLHMSEIYVKSGDTIQSGQVIGATGGTPGTKGAGRSTGPHLHFEYYTSTTSGPADPIPQMDRYFRFGGNIKVTPKPGSGTGSSVPDKSTVRPQENMMGQPVMTQQSGQPSRPQPSTTSSQPSADMQRKFQMAWDNRNNPFARGRIESAWGDMSSEQQQQAKTWAQSKGYDWNEMNLKEKPPTIQTATNTSTVVPVPSMQQMAPQQIQQYPEYNLPQSSLTLMPIIMGGGGSQQRPMVISGGGSGGGETTIMPAIPEGQVLNSLFRTILLTNLSGT